MDNADQKLKDLEDKLVPPGHADFSAVANGIGTGLTAVGLPMTMAKLFFPGKYQPSRATLVLSMVAACAVGAIYGFSEARRTREYRKNITDEMLQLRAEVDQLHQQLPVLKPAR